MAPSDASAPSSNAIAAAAYFLGILSGAAVLWRYPDDPFVRFHAWQSILFNLALAALVVAMEAVPLLGVGLVIVMVLAGVGVWGLLLLQAWRGRWFMLPLLGDLALERARVPRPRDSR